MTVCEKGQEILRQIEALREEYYRHIHWCPDCAKLRRRENIKYCWKITSGPYHVTLDGKLTLCGVPLTLARWPTWKWPIDDKKPPPGRNPCPRCQTAMAKDASLPAGA